MKRSPAAQRPRCAPQRRGAAAVEFALILPLFITIVLGCIDFGRFAYTYIAVTNAARVGAGYASTHPYTTTTLPAWRTETREAVRNEFGTTLNRNDFTMPDPTITSEAVGLKRVQVTVQGTFYTIVDWPGLPNEVHITRTVQMRMIR